MLQICLTLTVMTTTITEKRELYDQGSAFEGAMEVKLVPKHGPRPCQGDADVAGEDAKLAAHQGNAEEAGEVGAMEIVLEDGVTFTVELDSGERRLNELGYKQTLQRKLGFAEILGAAYNCTVILCGFIPYFVLTFENSGPAGMVWYWVLVAFFASFLALSLAEIASSLPVAGSLYFWAAYLAPPNWRAVIAFITGWLEFVSVAVTSAAVAISAAQVIQTIVFVWTGGAFEPDTSLFLSNVQLFGISVAFLVFCGLLLLLPIKVVGVYLAIAGAYQFLITIGSSIALPLIAPTTQPASWVFGHYETLFSITNTPSAAYAVVLSCLLGQYVLFSFDAAGHVSEETKESDLSSPFAIVGGCAISAVCGWGMIVAFLFSVQGDTAAGDSILAGDNITGGQSPLFQILWDCFYGRFGSGTGAFILYILYVFPLLNCSAAMMISSVRTVYALGRDNGLPFSNVFSKLNDWKVPVPAVILSTTIAIVSCCLLFVSTAAFFACAGTASSMWFMCYCITIALRVLTPEAKFVPGPFHLAKFFGQRGGKAVHIVALVYCMYTVVAFSIPTAFPVTVSDFNWSPVGIAITFFVLSLWWIVNARFWFKGPHVPGYEDLTV